MRLRALLTGAPSATTVISWRPEQLTGPIVTFGISLKAAATSKNWQRTAEFLIATLASLYRQTDPRFRILVCGHDLPDLPAGFSDKLEFIKARWSPPAKTASAKQLNDDKMKKRFLMGQRLRELGGGHFMQLDADDLVHRDLVGTCLNAATPYGVVITKGYVLDELNRRIAPVPGAWSVDIDRVCGSTSIVHFGKEDIPAGRWRKTLLPFERSAQHSFIRAQQDEYRRPLAVVGYPAVIYRLNTSENLSFARVRHSGRETGLLLNIEEHAISGPKLAEIDRDFGTCLAG